MVGFYQDAQKYLFVNKDRLDRTPGSFELAAIKCQILQALLLAPTEEILEMVSVLRQTFRGNEKHIFTRLIAEATLGRLIRSKESESGVRLLQLEPEVLVNNRHDLCLVNRQGCRGLLCVRASSNKQPIQASRLGWKMGGKDWEEVIADVIPAFYLTYPLYKPHYSLNMPIAGSYNDALGMAFIFIRNIDLSSLTFNREIEQMLMNDLVNFAEYAGN